MADELIALTKLRKSWPLEAMLAALGRPEPLTWTRWGDGEWAAILERRPGGKNVDGHPFTPELGRALADVLRDRPGYRLGLQPLACRIWPKPILQFLRQHGLTDLDWCDSEVLHRASRNHSLRLLIDHLRASPHPVVLVGPSFLRQLPQAGIPCTHHLPVPQRDAYRHYPQWWRQVADHLLHAPHSLVLVSASMPAKRAIHDWRSLFPDRHHLLDCGSLWDPYCGVISRAYMRGIDPHCFRESA